MRYPLRWFGRGFARLCARLGRSSPSLERETSRDAAAPRHKTKDLLVEIAGEIAALRQTVHSTREHDREELAAIASRLEVSFAARLEQVESEVTRLREAVDHKFAESEERGTRLDKGQAEIQGRIGEVVHGVEQLTDAFDRQLASTEEALAALREAGERRVTELRAAHRRHVRSLEQSREEVWRSAQRCHDRLTKRAEEIVDYLEKQHWPAVPLGNPPVDPGPSDGKKVTGLRRVMRPLSAVVGWTRREHLKRRKIAYLEKRASDLEELLRDRWNENLSQGRQLRKALGEEAAAFPEPPAAPEIEETEDTPETPDPYLEVPALVAALGRNAGGRHGHNGNGRDRRVTMAAQTSFRP